MPINIPYLGEALALLTAVTWAFAVILFKKSGETVHPVALNLFKNSLSVILFVPTLVIMGETLFRPVPARDYLLLLASGAIGIGIADTMFFKSLNILGAGLSAIVDCLYSPFMILASMLWLNETLNGWQLIGALLIISAVLTATKDGNSISLSRRNLVLGILLGASGMALMAVGLVMIKKVLDASPLLWVTEMRLVGGAVSVALILLFFPSRRTILSSLWKTKSWKYTITGSVAGAYLSMLLWLAGMKYASVSVASALNQTSNIFIFIFAALILKETITRRRVLGITLAIGGAFMVMFL